MAQEIDANHVITKLLTKIANQELLIAQYETILEQSTSPDVVDAEIVED